MQRPLPQPNTDTEPFWQAAKDGRLVIQYCPRTGEYQHPPQPYMAACGFEWEWREAPGTGALYSFTVVHAPALPGFDPPYAVGLIDLDEAGVRVIAPIKEIDISQIEIGMRLAVRFEQMEDTALMYFVPRA